MVQHSVDGSDYAPEYDSGADDVDGADEDSDAQHAAKYQATSAGSADSPLLRLLAANLGNVLEMYDFSVFGFIAPELGVLFFPGSSARAQLLKAFAVFSGGLFMRPVGGVLFGWLGDRYGRKAALRWSVLVMAMCTTLVGLLPTFRSVGRWAPLLLVVLRLLQGLSVGGQVVGSFIYTVESAPKSKRGFYSSCVFGSIMAGTAVGSLVMYMVHRFTTPRTLLDFGWRIPFLAGLPLGFVALLLQRFVGESPEFVEAMAGGQVMHHATPFHSASHVLAKHSSRVIQVTLVVATWAAGFYMGWVWVPVYESRLAHTPLPKHVSFAINTWTAFGLALVALPFFGWISDRLRRRGTMIRVGLAAVIFASPLAFLLLERGRRDLRAVVFGHVLLSLVMALFGAPLCDYMVKAFPPQDRYSAIGIGYNVAHALFAGTAPLIATALIHVLHSAVWPGLYLSAIAVVSLAALLFT